MKYSEIISHRIITLCEKRKITVNKFATMSNVRQSTVDGIVRNITKNPQLKTVNKLVICLSMTISEFLDFIELNEFTFEDEK